ncbi:hypothetical protein OAL15_01800 [Flavobacteriales bacterium]|nr:hypothetical protein [Flavobacteriales bacterium]
MYGSKSGLIFLAITLVFFGAEGWAQDSTQTKVKFSDIVRVSGYVKNLNIISYSDNAIIGNSNENFLHNRLNLRIYPIKNLTVAAEFRNRLFYSRSTASTLRRNLGQDPGLLDMSWNIGKDYDPVQFNAQIDRLWVAYGNDRFDLRIGRQRVNWGINTAWNPNDIFNAYNFIDFDYSERPGTDAARFQYFGKKMRGFEAVVAPRANWKETTSAFMYKFNAKGYDFQLIGGQAKEDVTAGFGFAGNLKNAGLKGEVQWFAPWNGFTDSTHTLTGVISADYAFKNSLYISGSILYSSNGIEDSNPIALASFFSGTPLDAKNLMPTKYNGFLTMRYSITPLLSSSIAVIYGYGPHLLLLNPSLTFSIVENWDLLLAAQLFFSEFLVEENGFPVFENGVLKTSYQNVSNSVFLRLQWSY